MSKILPENASLEHLKAQAKDLLKVLRSSDRYARLHQAQHQIAQEYGFASWPKLYERVASMVLSRLSNPELIKTVEHGIRQGRFAVKARHALESHPGLVDSSLTCALMALDETAARRQLNPASIGDLIGDFKCPEIIYAAFSPFGEDKPEAYLSILTWLIEAGADVDATFTGPDFPDSPLSILYAASAMVRSPEATEMLLKRGANPNDNESLYHSTESRDHACLKLLLDYGAKIEGSNALARALDFEDLEALNLLLAHSPNLDNPSALAHAIRRGRSERILARLIEAGADPNYANIHWGTPAQLAFERGITLPALVGNYKPSAQEELLAACWRGNVAEATRLKAAYEGMPLMRKRALTDACWVRRAETVDAFVAAGFSLTEDRDDSKGTALHVAAFQGSVSTVQALLRHGPPLDDAKDMYNAIPLQWAAHSSMFNKGPEFNLPGVIQVLIEAGSPPPNRIFGSEPVRDLLRDKWPELKEED